MQKKNDIWRAWERAREREAKRGNRLTPKEFLDAIDPRGKRTNESAGRYLRKLRSGERSGSKIEKSAKDVSGAIVNVRYEVKRGDIRSANVRLPSGRSRLDQWNVNVQKALRKAANEYLEREYRRRQEPAHIEKQTKDQKRGTYVPVKRLPRGAKYQSMMKLRKSRYATAPVRIKS